MERLVYVALAALLVGVAVCGSGLWLLHTALNDGNVWKGILATFMAVIGGRYAFVAALALGIGR